MNGLPDRVAIIGTTIPGGDSVLCRNLIPFLESHGITVDFYDANLYTMREFQKQRVDPSLMKVPVLKRVLLEIARKLRVKEYPIVIATQREDIFLEFLPPTTRKFYYCSSPIAYEHYYRWLFKEDPDAEKKFQKALEVERNIYSASDIITFVPLKNSISFTDE